MVKIKFESPSVQLSHVVSAELINFFHVERPGINLNI